MSGTLFRPHVGMGTITGVTGEDGEVKSKEQDLSPSFTCPLWPSWDGAIP